MAAEWCISLSVTRVCIASRLQEWQSVTIAGRSKAAARAGGHILTVHGGEVHLFGGRDALNAQTSHLLKLKKLAGGARWVLANGVLGRCSHHPSLCLVAMPCEAQRSLSCFVSLQV
jgi:hypothetical protein